MLLTQHVAFITCALLEKKCWTHDRSKNLQRNFAQKEKDIIVVQRVQTVGRGEDVGSSKMKKRKNFISWLSQSVINDPCWRETLAANQSLARCFILQWVRCNLLSEWWVVGGARVVRDDQDGANLHVNVGEWRRSEDTSRHWWRSGLSDFHVQLKWPRPRTIGWGGGAAAACQQIANWPAHRWANLTF